MNSGIKRLKYFIHAVVSLGYMIGMCIMFGAWMQSVAAGLFMFAAIQVACQFRIKIDV